MSYTERMKEALGLWGMKKKKKGKSSVFKRISQLSRNGQYCFLALKNKATGKW